MAHRIAGRKLGRATDHRLALFRNLVTDLLRYEKIITTEAKAKEVRGLAERVITLGKRGDLSRSAPGAWVTCTTRKSSKSSSISSARVTRSGPAATAAW